MIQVAFNTVIYMMLARFMLNDLPHAAGLFGGNKLLGRDLSNTSTRQEAARMRFQQLKQYLHSLEDLHKFANRAGIVKVYHGCPTHYAKLLVQYGPRVPYKVEDVARYVAQLYGLRWIELAPFAYRKHEVVEKLSTSTASVAARWAWTFKLGEVLTDLNEQARIVVAARDLAISKGIKLRDAYEEVHNRAEAAAGHALRSGDVADALGLPDKIVPPEEGSSLVEIMISSEAVPGYISHQAQQLLDILERKEDPIQVVLAWWNYEYRDIRIDPESIRSSRIVITGMMPWEQDVVEDLIREELGELQ